MKKFILLGIAALFMPACETDDSGGDGYTCVTCTTAPEAVAADDGKPSGVYKGILAGETVTGTIKVVIKSDLSAASCEVRSGGETLTSASFSSALRGALTDSESRALGQNTTYTFSGTGFAFTLVLDSATGDVVSSTMVLDGSTVPVATTKETSTTLVECFEGTWAQSKGGSETGIWNFVLYGTSIIGSSNGGTFTGTVSGNTISIAIPGADGGSASGNFSSNHQSLSGSWTGAGGAVGGTWTGNRTL